jgi:hypothetical protein
MGSPRPMARRVPLLVALTAALVWAGGSQAAVSQTLYAYFDVDGAIQLRYADSSNIGSTIPPGTYTVNLNNNGADDLGVDHIYHLFGPGVDYKAANVDTQATFTATFQTGATYTAQDDLNPKIHLTFVATTATVAPAATTTTTSTPSTKAPKPTSSDIVGSGIIAFRGTLDGIVGAAGRLTLTYQGKTVTTLKAGKYRVAVVDGTAKSGFELRSSHSVPVVVTSTTFVGKRSATVVLSAGRWWFFSPGGKKTYFTVV